MFGDFVCDKCQRPVEQNNDAVLVEAYALGTGVPGPWVLPRHFLPTDYCEGSPSRAQYIEGQPERSYHVTLSLITYKFVGN